MLCSIGKIEIKEKVSSKIKIKDAIIITKKTFFVIIINKIDYVSKIVQHQIF